MKVLDPDLAAAKRAEVQAGMVSEKVLDIAKYQEVTFSSTMVTAAGADKWTVVGRLTIHGEISDDHRSGGPSRRNLSRFGGDQAAGLWHRANQRRRGTVKVKDQLMIEFDIVARMN